MGALTTVDTRAARMDTRVKKRMFDLRITAWRMKFLKRDFDEGRTNRWLAFYP